MLEVNLRSQEVSIVFAGNLASKVLRRQMELVALGGFGTKALGAFLEQLQSICLVNLFALCGKHTMLHPLPKLATGNLGSGSILPVSRLALYSLTLFILLLSSGQSQNRKFNMSSTTYMR